MSKFQSLGDCFWIDKYESGKKVIIYTENLKVVDDEYLWLEYSLGEKVIARQFIYDEVKDIKNLRKMKKKLNLKAKDKLTNKQKWGE